MSKLKLSLISLLLIWAICCPILAGCSDDAEQPTGPSNSETSEAEQSAETSAETTAPSSETSTGVDTTESDTTEETNETTLESESIAGPQIEGSHAALIENADALKNGVNAYFPYPNRTHFAFENLEMVLDYALNSAEDQQVASLKNKDGQTYLENTMDVFVKMTDGKTYFASQSGISTTANIYRFGYYFYEMRLEEQEFSGEYEILAQKRVKHTNITGKNHIESTNIVSGELDVLNAVDASDPYIVFGKDFDFSADTYKLLKITMKADNKAATNGAVFVIAGSQNHFTAEQCVSFPVINDGEYHDYIIPIYACTDYNGTLKGIRLDISGPGASYSIKELAVLAVDTSGMPDALGLNRSFNVYSDKMHQIIQIAARSDTKNIAEIGMLTEISADTVAKLIVKDANGTHETIEGVDWATAEYIGFDIKGTGVFGYILPYDGRGGQLTVTLENGIYKIVQTQVPENNQILASPKGTNNMNDFFMGQRIYTDDNHTFDEFLYEAECERNPLKDAFFKIDADHSTNAGFSGYDSLQGYYLINLSGPGGGFSTPYYQEPNKHYRVGFAVRGDNYDRNIYVMTYTKSGQLECAVLLDENDVLLPVPLEVGKNFSEENGERNLYNLDDPTYGQAIFPMVIKAKSRDNVYTVLNLYQRWGNFPLKQISWIQFHAPYYHLSTGVTETNCIVPWYSTKNSKSLNTLPDFRSMSAPFWTDQPQHNSCGTHHWLKYTDAEGNFVTSENVLDIIDSYGPTYADVSMDYISDDGKIKVNYVHSEMPQTDENRTFYEITYEVLEDVSIKNFKNDFQFYSVTPNDPTGWYKQVGYLNENNEYTVVDAMTNGTKQYILGDNCPYFSFFNMENYTSQSAQGYSNVAFLVYNSEFIIGGEKSDAKFIISDNGDTDTISISLNLDEVTLKAGDTFTINAILMPWGSQESVYDGSNGKAPDQNVRNVREDTLLNPLKATAEADCEVIESVFVPKLMSANGESAEFTLSGGNNNVAVRIYGFEKMTVPMIYEKINGEWKEYVVNSLATPDQNGDAHAYDGYMIHYDGDGTFSYSFVVAMDNGMPRTFKIVADGNYEAWEKEINKNPARPDLLNVYVDHQEIEHDLTASMISSGFISRAEIDADGTYVRLFGAGPDGKSEAYRIFYAATTSMVTGQYAVVKYRIPTANTTSIDHFEIYTSTLTGTAVPENGFKVNAAVKDGEWHVIVVDLTKVEKDVYLSQFKSNADGEYAVQFLRFDFFNHKMDLNDYIDIAYVGIDSDLEKIYELNADMDEVILLEGNSKYFVDPKTGEKLEYTSSLPTQYIHPDSEYTRSNMHYAGQIDFLNGKSTVYSFTYGDLFVEVPYGAKAIASPETENAAAKTGSYMVVAGWSVVEGGVDKYVFSVDDGKTWTEVSLYGRESYGDANDAMISGATSRVANTFTFNKTRDAKNTSYQGSPGNNPTGILIDLSAYAGKTVNVILAAVPVQEPGTLCPLFCISSVTVAGAQAPTELPSQYIHPDSEYKKSSLKYAGQIDYVNGVDNGQTFSYGDAFIEISYGAKAIADPKTQGSASRSGTYMVFGGWTVVEGGISKYVFSVDNGKTWTDATFCGDGLRNAYGGLITAATNRVNSTCIFDAAKDAKNANFQGAKGNDPTGMMIDLSAYVGQTVNVILAAVPINETGTLCPLLCISGIAVDKATGTTTPTVPETPKEPRNYAGQVDLLNGQFVNSACASNNHMVGQIYYGKESIASPETPDAATKIGTYLVLGGWIVVEGGVDRYVWSADNGETWNNVSLYGRDSYGNASTTMINSAFNYNGKVFTFESARDASKGSFQGSTGNSPTGIVINLSAYAGRTVNVLVAAVPAMENSDLCQMVNIVNVTVPSN